MQNALKVENNEFSRQKVAKVIRILEAGLQNAKQVK